MIIFVLIGIAAGLLLAAQLTGKVPLTIMAMAISLISIVLVIARVWVERRNQRLQSATPVPADDAGAAETEDSEVEVQSVAETEATDESVDVAEGEEPNSDLQPVSERTNVSDHDEAVERAAGLEGDESSVADDVAPAAVVPDAGGELVRVIPGRKRFHDPGCGALSGRQSEELTREEAEEEGFTACSLCSVKSTTIRRVV